MNNGLAILGGYLQLFALVCLLGWYLLRDRGSERRRDSPSRDASKFQD